MREGHRRRGKSTVHETQSRAIFHRRAQSARGSNILVLVREREKGPFFSFGPSSIAATGPPSLLMRDWSDSSAQEEFANPLLEENPLLFFSLPSLPNSQPANKYNLFCPCGWVVGGCQAGLPSSHNIQQFFPPESFSTLFLYIFLFLLLPTGITDSHNSEGKGNIRKKGGKKRGWTVERGKSGVGNGRWQRSLRRI